MILESHNNIIIYDLNNSNKNNKIDNYYKDEQQQHYYIDSDKKFNMLDNKIDYLHRSVVNSHSDLRNIGGEFVRFFSNNSEGDRR